MASPNRLSPDTSYPDTIAMLNDNFEKAVQDVGDLGAKFSGTATTSVTVAAGGFTFITVHVTDPLNQYAVGKIPVWPRAEVHVDTDDDSHIHPDGASLSSEQKNTDINIRVNRRAYTGDVATYYVAIRNLGASSHTYFLTLDNSYQQSPPTGNFR